MNKSIYLAVVLTLCASGNTWASFIQQNTTGTSATTGSGFFDGQSVTTPSGGPWDDIGFNFEQCASPSGVSCLSTTTNSPYALGGLYLLTQVYDGLPSGLSSSTPGFVAFTNTIVGGVWTFASSVTLNPSTQYFFYMDTAFGGVEVVYDNSDPYPGGQAYGANTGNGPTYGSDDAALVSSDNVFALTGDSAVPEPGTGALMALVMAGLAGSRALLLRCQRSHQGE